MLVLSRKKSQQIRIGDSIVVTVLRTSPGGIRLGIQAPGLKVVRAELAEKEAGNAKN